LKQSYEEVGGTSSTGEFVTVLAKISTRSDTKLNSVDTDVVRNNRALIYEYSIMRDKAKQLNTVAGRV
jgi:hypothetical protein